MGLRILGFLLALVAVTAVTVQAQGQPALTLQVTTPSGAIEPGSTATLTVEATRSCANAVQVLEAQDVHIAFFAPDGWLVDGPLQGRFERQVCAQQPQQTIAFAYDAIADPSVRGGRHPFTVVVGAEEASVTTPSIPDTPQDFVLLVPPEEPQPTYEPQPDDKESPGVGWLAPLLGLALVLALRRR